MLKSQKLKKLKNQGGLVFKTSFLQNLSLLERYEFLQLCHRRNYKDGEYIYHQGDPGAGMYFIEEGKVQLIVEPEESDEEPYTFELEAPESFGALSLGYDIPRMSSVQCKTGAILLGFFQPDFSTLRDRHPKIAIKIMESIAYLSMKQLEITTNALAEATSLQNAFSLQFKTIYLGRAGDSLA